MQYKVSKIAVFGGDLADGPFSLSPNCRGHGEFMARRTLQLPLLTGGSADIRNQTLVFASLSTSIPKHTLHQNYFAYRATIKPQLISHPSHRNTLVTQYNDPKLKMASKGEGRESSSLTHNLPRKFSLCRRYLRCQTATLCLTTRKRSLRSSLPTTPVLSIHDNLNLLRTSDRKHGGS